MRIRRLQNALTSVYYMREAFQKAWPELLANQPEYAELLHRIQKDINTLVDIANIKMTILEYEAAQLRVNSDPCSSCGGEGWVLNEGFVKVQCPECKNARAGYASSLEGSAQEAKSK